MRLSPRRKRGRKSKTQKTQDAKETIRGLKRAEPDAPVSAASVPKSKKVQHGWSVVPVSGSAEPVSLVCDGSRKRTEGINVSSDVLAGRRNYGLVYVIVTRVRHS